MKVFVGVNWDLQIWVGKTLDDVIRKIEDDCGGYVLSKETRRKNFWILEWFIDENADIQKIFVTEEDVD